MSVLCILASSYFRFWSKTYTKPCTSNSLLSSDKTISSLLELLITCFRFQNMFWKIISCFGLWWKTCIKRSTKNYVISGVKTLSSPSLCVWSSSIFQFQDMIWKTEEYECKQKCWIKNYWIYFADCLLSLL